MAEDAVTFLLETLSQKMIYFHDLVTGAKNELKQLSNQLELLRSFLEEAAQKQVKEEPFRILEKQIREVVYDAEDAIDSCLTQAAAAKSKNLFYRLIFNLKRASLAKMVKSVREDKVKPMFDQAKTDFGTMTVGDGSSTSRVQSWTNGKEEDLPRPEHNVIGFEHDQKIIISYLEDDRDRNTLDVIRITGIPGEGKTTLARKIFNNTDVQCLFDFNIWVDVSQDFNRRDVLLNIMEQLTSQDVSSMKNNELALIVRGRLEKAKFFIVLDDIWTDEAWNDIRKMLPNKNGKSKVLITSRHDFVGANAAAREPHKLQRLNINKSWELLELEVFEGLGKCPKDLIVTGKYIADQCGGLPLSIVVVGGILRKKSETRQGTTSASILNAWKEVSENLSSALYGDKNISKIVALSYNILPHEMRDCLLYLGMFPEDCEIPVSTLTHLWIAEGFIKRRTERSMEETANEFIKELIDRNLVTVGKSTARGEIKTCRVQDVIRDFCISEAEQMNLLQEIKRSKEEDFVPPASEIHKCRRLCIHSNLQGFLSKIISTKVKGRGVRSFLSFCQPVPLDTKYITTIPDAFNLLRVMHSKSIKFPQFPMKITKLIHLRYITLSFNFELDVLPEAVSELWNLQTLIVDTKSRSLEIKANIWRMFELRHLKTKAEIILAIKLAEGDKGGEKLQTLSRLSPKHCTKDVFKRARNLKRLGIRGSLARDFTGKYLEKLENLENLKLVNDLPNGSPSENRLGHLPSHNCFPKKIKRLTLSSTYLDWTDMHTLGMIETLQVLKLKDYAFTGKSWHPVTGSGFPSLQFLLIAKTDLVFWEAPNDHFPRLTCLVLKICVNLMEIPLGLATSLEILELENVGKSAVESAEKIKWEREVMLQGHGKPRPCGLKLSIKS